MEVSASSAATEGIGASDHASIPSVPESAYHKTSAGERISSKEQPGAFFRTDRPIGSSQSDRPSRRESGEEHGKAFAGAHR
jgi:hypothetical protein